MTNSGTDIKSASAYELAALYQAAKDSAFAYTDAFGGAREGEMREYARSQVLANVKICAGAANALKVTIAYTPEDREARLLALRDWYEGLGDDDPDLIAMFGRAA